MTFSSTSSTFPGASENDLGPLRRDDVDVKDLESGSLTLVSTNVFGASGDESSSRRTICADGRYVAFGSYATNVAPLREGLRCPLKNVCSRGFSYVKDLATGHVALVPLGLGDVVPDEWDQTAAIISGEGRYAGFASWSSNLVNGDTVDTLDYLRAPNPVAEAPCSSLAVYPRLAAVAHAHPFYSWATELVHSTPAEDDDDPDANPS